MLLAVALTLTAACTMYRDKPPQSFAEATGGEGLERIFWKQVKAGNWTEIERVLASNYVGTTAVGTVDRAAALDQYRQWKLNDLSLGGVRTELNGSTMVVTYTITLNGTVAGQPLPSGALRMMSVWQQQSRGWIQIAHSAGW